MPKDDTIERHIEMAEKRTEQELKDLMVKETELIKELEKSYPKIHGDVHEEHRLYREDNLPWQIHHTKVRDAYWRRRMWQTELEGGDLTKTAQVY